MPRLLRTPQAGRSFVLLLAATLLGLAARSPVQAQETELAPPDAAAETGFFGAAVAADKHGHTALVGAPVDSVRGNSVRGTDGRSSAYLFTRRPEDGSYTRAARLTGPDRGAAGGLFGQAVALSADGAVALVGAPGDAVDGRSGQGSAYVFTREDGAYTRAARLTAADGAAGDAFGSAVAMGAGGDVLLVGAPSDDVDGRPDQGSAYVFTRENGGGSYARAARLTGPDRDTLAGAPDHFGTAASMSADGTDVLVGAPGDAVDGRPGQGSAYVFTREGDGGSYSRAARLTAADGAARDFFGEAVSLDAGGRRALVGAPLDDVDGARYQGSAVVFTRQADGSYEQSARLTAPDGSPGARFGGSVSVGGDRGRLLVGGEALTTDLGTVHVFARRGDGSYAQQQAALTTTAGSDARDELGYATAFSADGAVALAGASGDDAGEGAGPGRAFVYRIIPASPTGLTASADSTDNGIALTWTASASSGATTTLLYRSPFGSGKNTLLATLGADTTHYVDRSAEAGTRYYYRLRARDAADDASGFSTQATAFRAPATVAYRLSRRFSGADDASDHRLVALPGAGRVPPAKVLGGDPGTAGWSAYRQGESGDTLVSYREAGGEGFAFAPGEGLWVAAEQGLNRSAAPPAPEVGADGVYPVALHEGWNVVSNPFGERGFAWNAVQRASGARQPLWSFTEEGYARADTLAPAGAKGRAYYFYNRADLAALRLPYAPDSAAAHGGADSLEAPPGRPAAAQWALTLTASTPDASSSDSTAAGSGDDFAAVVHAAAAEGAKAGPGPRDVMAPPGRFEPVSLALLPQTENQTENPTAVPRLATAYQPVDAGAEGERFELRLRAAPGATVALRSRVAAALPPGWQPLLIRRRTGAHFQLDPGATLTAEAKTERFALVVGTKAFREAAVQNAVPDEHALIGSYPNPFRERATVAYEVSEESPVRLVVYDLLGREVRTLVDETQSAGKKRATLQARSLSSGVYVFRLRVGDYTETGRLVHVR
jgi:hypothetical protein